jgi:hypothetical protein
MRVYIVVAWTRSTLEWLARFATILVRRLDPNRWMIPVVADDADERDVTAGTLDVPRDVAPLLHEL